MNTQTPSKDSFISITDAILVFSLPSPFFPPWAKNALNMDKSLFSSLTVFVQWRTCVGGRMLQQGRFLHLSVYIGESAIGPLDTQGPSTFATSFFSQCSYKPTRRDFFLSDLGILRWGAVTTFEWVESLDTTVGPTQSRLLLASTAVSASPPGGKSSFIPTEAHFAPSNRHKVFTKFSPTPRTNEPPQVLPENKNNFDNLWAFSAFSRVPSRRAGEKKGATPSLHIDSHMPQGPRLPPLPSLPPLRKLRKYKRCPLSHDCMGRQQHRYPPWQRFRRNDEGTNTGGRAGTSSY